MTVPNSVATSHHRAVQQLLLGALQGFRHGVTHRGVGDAWTAGTVAVTWT